jgi:lipopolysaccharide export system permease protein
MKILQRYILREHIAPFFFAFFAITFLLIIDYVPKIIDHVLDKNLSIWVVLELVALNLAWMLALSVPMSFLVGTLMAFGRLGSDFEITAVKAAGVNLIHILLPLLLAALLVMVGMIQFNDKILPDLNKKARQLWGDIAAMRPTLSFQSGIFISDVPGYLILIDKIDHATSRVEGVKITDTKVASRPRVVIADYGYLEMTDNGKNMRFTLHDGELHTMDIHEPENYRRMDFDKHIINVVDAGSELVRSDSEYRTDREMGIGQMQDNIERAQVAMLPISGRIQTSLQNKLGYLYADTFAYRTTESISDSVALHSAKNEVLAWSRSIQRNHDQIKTHSKVMNRYRIEIYKKFSIPAATLAFILIGAPLGMLTRRGGMGMAIAVSIALFLIYWAFLIGGEDIADRGLVTPFWAMWSANILLGAIGLYLIYIVVSERPVFAWFRKRS